MRGSGATWRRWLGPMPSHREARVMASLALALGAVLCVISLLLGLRGKAFLGRPLGGDFLQFYTVGKILNCFPPARIYDLQLAVHLQHSTVPSMPDSQMLFFANGPWIVDLFRPFALLSYAWAYAAWLGFSAGLYAAGLAILFRTVRLNAEDRKTGFLLALSSAPFLFETWIGGQISVLAFFVWVLFFWCLDNDRRFLAGLVLALCLFRPTLVALPALMLIVGRRWRIVAGLAAGSIGVALWSLATVGLDGCRAWWSALTQYGALAKTGEAWQRMKYVDILAFLHLLIPNPTLVNAAAAAAAAITVTYLGLVWWKSEPRGEGVLWAATLCFTLIVSPYAPMYDAIVLVVALSLARSDRRNISGWLTLLYLVAWVTQSFAQYLHLQLLTLAIAAFGIWLLKAGGVRINVSHFITREEKSTMTARLQPGATGRFQVCSKGLL